MARTRTISFLMNCAASNVQMDEIVLRAKTTLPDFLCNFFLTRSLRDLDDALAQVTAMKSEALVIAGGDGTINKTLPFLKEFKIPIYIYPAGTANDLARQLGTTKNFKQMRACIMQNKAQKLDLIFVNGVPFVTGGGIGIGAKLTRYINEVRKTYPGFKKLMKLAGGHFYTWAAVEQILTGSNETRKYSIISDNDTSEIETGNMFISNQPKIGGDLLLSPDAQNNDGLLDVVAFKANRLPDLIKSFSALKLGLPLPDIARFQAKKFEIIAHDQRPIMVFGDGEALVEAPHLIFEVHPAALTVFVGQK